MAKRDHISKMVSLLEKAWRTQPDMPMCKLIYSLALEIGHVKDPIFLKDDALMAHIERYVKKAKKET